MGDKGRKYQVTCTPTQLVFFSCFIRGLDKRMGKVVKTDLGLSIDIMIELLRRYEDEVTHPNTSKERERERQQWLDLIARSLTDMHSGEMKDLCWKPQI